MTIVLLKIFNLLDMREIKNNIILGIDNALLQMKNNQQVRKLSTIVMLSDPKKFKGGDLEFYEYSPPKSKIKY